MILIFSDRNNNIPTRDGTGNSKRPVRPGPVPVEFLTGRYTGTSRGFGVFTYFAWKTDHKSFF